MGWRRACRYEDVPADRGWPVTVDARPLAVFRLGKGVAVVDNVCRHLAFPIDDGKVEHGRVTCPWHGWTYDLRSGDHVTMFGRRPGLRRYEARVDPDGAVWVDVD